MLSRKKWQKADDTHLIGSIVAHHTKGLEFNPQDYYNNNKLFFFPLVFFKEMQVKTALRFCPILVGMIIVRGTTGSQVGKNVDKKEPLSSAGINAKLQSHCKN